MIVQKLKVQHTKVWLNTLRNTNTTYVILVSPAMFDSRPHSYLHAYSNEIEGPSLAWVWVNPNVS